MTIHDFNRKYIEENLNYNDIVWYLSSLEGRKVRVLGNLNAYEPNAYLYFVETTDDGCSEQMCCHISSTKDGLRFSFTRSFWEGDEDPYHTDNFKAICLRSKAKGYKSFAKFAKDFCEKYV